MKVVGDPAWERGRRQGLTGDAFERFQATPRTPGRLGAMRRLRDWSLRRSSAITAPSEYLAAVVDGWLGGPSGVTVIANGVRVLDEDAAPREDDGGLQLIFVGRLVAHKQVDRIVRAVAATPGVCLEVVGTGPEGDVLEQLARDLDVNERVTLVGDLPHAAVLRAIGTADALVLASDYEGLPHVVLEALAAGTPVVSPPVGGVAEVVVDGASGLLLADARRDDHRGRAGTAARRRSAPGRLRSGARTAGARWTISRTTDDVESTCAASRRPKPRIVTLGKAGWPEPLTSTVQHKLELLVRHEDPAFVQTGRTGARHAGRARVVLFPKAGPLASVLFYTLAPVVAVGLAASRRPTAVVCQSPFEGVGAVTLTRLLPASLRPRVVIEVHGDWTTASRGYADGALRARIAPAADRAARWALQRADAVRVISSFTEDLVRRAGYRGRTDRYVAYTDAGHLLARSPVPPPDIPAVAYVGALERTKGIDVLVEAWREVRRRVPDATLEVVGDGAMRGIAARDVRALGIRFHGQVPHEQVTEVLDGVRFLVVPSRSEGLGRVVWEASARGRPVVASAVGGIPEQVREGQTGLLVTPEDPSALADAIVRMLAEPQRCAAMGAEAHRSAATRDPVGEFEGGVARLAAWVGRR